MKKSTVFLTFSLVAAVLVYPIAGIAAVSGRCDNCHTMHNSQGGDPMVFGEGVVGPLSALLRSDCLGCHTTTGNDPLATTTVDAEGLYPFVMASSSTAFSDDNCLAGGFFNPDTVYDPVTGGDPDNNSDMNHTLGSTALPAGYASAKFPGAGYQNQLGLGCAGSNGCHGVHDVADDMEAIKGGHHATSAAYRMLFVGNDMTAANAVVGIGASDYEKAIINSVSTVPQPTGPTPNVNTYSAGENDPSISELCAICHGDFHGTTETGGPESPWLRHPTDLIIPDETNGTAWPIADEGVDLTRSDYINNPVGYDGADYSAGERRVICLSCHRAHGTENPDLLRWPYGTQDAGSGTLYGCLGCHIRQR